MYDVIVVGAGPAGSTCARMCAEKGLKTLLLEKKRFPRHKPCAGAVSAYALSLLDFDLPPDTIEKECFSAKIDCNGRSIEVRKDEKIAVLVRRDRFDMLLAQRAVERGSLLLQGECVVEVVQMSDCVIVKTQTRTYRARFLIGADGVQSCVANLIRSPFRKDELALAVVCEPPVADREIEARLSRTLSFSFGAAPRGYAWLFPHRAHYSMGAAGLACRFAEPRGTVSAYARSVQIDIDALRGHFIPLGGIKRRIAADRVLLAGDAAGFADPLHGEGIAYAIVSGKLAAEAVIGAVQTGVTPLHSAERYMQDCERGIRRQLKVALRMAKLLDRFPRLLARILLNDKKPIEQFLEIPSGRSDYRRFQRWMLPRVPFYLFRSFVSDIRLLFPRPDAVKTGPDAAEFRR